MVSERRFRRARIAFAFLLALGTAACGPLPAGSGEYADLEGEINADGSSTVFPITQAVAEEFNIEASNVRTSVGVSGTGGGFEKFCSGETDLSNASRAIKQSEIDRCKKNGIEYLQLTVAIDGLSIVVNPENTWAKCLTTEELRKIWEPGAQNRIDNWREVRPGFPNRKLKLYGPGTDSGTFDYFTAEIVGEEGKSRSDYTASEDDNVLVQGLAGDKGALGYFGFAYYEENQSKIQIVGVDPGTGCVTPTRETINTGTYAPLSRPLFVYVSKKAAARPEVRTFVDFYLENVNDFVESVGYIDMPPDVLAEQKAAWEAFRG